MTYGHLAEGVQRAEKEEDFLAAYVKFTLLGYLPDTPTLYFWIALG